MQSVDVSNQASPLRLGVFPNNPSTFAIFRACEDALVAEGIQPVLMFPSARAQQVITQGVTIQHPIHYVGCDFPWRTRRRFGAWTFFYLLSWLRLKKLRLSSVCDALLIFKDDGTLDKLLCLQANMQSIPSFCLQEGAVYEFDEGKGPKQKNAKGFDRIVRKRIHPSLVENYEKGLLSSVNLVYGDKKKRSLVEAGFAQERICIVGNPLYDAYRLAKQPEAPDRSILFAHQQTFDKKPSECAWFRALAEGAALANVRLDFKLHPRSKRKSADITEMLSGLMDHVRLIEGGDIQSQKMDAGLFVTGDSTAVYRALIDGVTPLLIDYVVSGRRLDLGHLGAALAPKDPESLPQLIAKFFADSDLRNACSAKRKQAISEHIGPVDGHAGRRIAQSIMQNIS